MAAEEGTAVFGIAAIFSIFSSIFIDQLSRILTDETGDR